MFRGGNGVSRVSQETQNMMVSIERAVIHAAAEQGGVAVTSVSPATHFQNDLNFDSLDAVEFTMKVEDALGVSIPSERVAELTTVQLVIEYVKSQRSGA